MKNILKLSSVLVCIICLTACGNSLKLNIDETTYPYPDSKDTLVTMSEYKELNTGMTEKEVWDIIGGECTKTSTTDVGSGEEYITTSYGCNGSGSEGATVILMFLGGKLSTLTQVGLQ